MIASRFEQDLKLLDKEALAVKYGPQAWDEYYEKMVRGEKIDPLEPIAEIRIPEEIALPADLPDEAEPLAAPPYKGRAFGRFVMIRRLEHEHTGRLVMPERISGTSDVGWVASVGEETKYVEKGNIVIFDQFASVGRECRLVDDNGLPGQFLLIEEPDILAILEKI